MMCVSAKTNLLEFDKYLPNRGELLDADLMKRKIGQTFGLDIATCEIIRAKYKINSSLRVLYRILANGKTELISARIYAKNQNETNLQRFPNDRKIGNLKVLQEKFVSRVVAYAPEKCVTVECLDAGGQIFAYAKIYAEKEFKTGEKVFQFLTEQSEKNAQNRFPRIIDFDRENRLLMIEAVKGKRLADLDKQQITRGFQLLGRAVADLHNIQTSVSLPEFSRLSPARINFAIDAIALARPDCLTAARKLSEKLLESSRFADEENVCLHGDVHPKNGILIDNKTLSLIDFDQLSIGNPAAEIGSFVAGLRYKELIGSISRSECLKSADSFLEGYAEIRALPIRESRNWHTATALLTERALRSISRIRIEGLQHFSEILLGSERILAGGEL